MASDDELHPYQVLLTDKAKHAYRQITPKSLQSRLDRILDVLDTVPDIGGIYDPVYEAAKPPFELRIVHAGRYGVYYRVLEDCAQVHVYFIEDHRRGPLNRFSPVEERREP